MLTSFSAGAQPEFWCWYCESVSASERQDEEQMPRETGTRQGRTPPTGDPHRGEDPAEDPPPERRATQGTYTEHTQTPRGFMVTCRDVVVFGV